MISLSIGKPQCSGIGFCRDEKKISPISGLSPYDLPDVLLWLRVG